MQEKGVERRQSERQPQHRNVVFKLDTDETEFYGTSFDISDHGLGFCTSAPVHEGQIVFIKNDLPVTYHKGVIKWVKGYLKSFHRAGVMFLE